MLYQIELPSNLAVAKHTKHWNYAKAQKVIGCNLTHLRQAKSLWGAEKSKVNS
jgi:hypothetical protein